MHIGINGYFTGQEATGSGQYLAHLLEALAAVGDNRYTLFAPAQAQPAPADTSPGAPRGWRTVHMAALVRHEHLAKVWFEQFAFPRACRASSVDLAHVPYFASPLFPRTPTIVTIHDLIPLLLPAYRGDIRVRAYTRLVSLAARRADAILTDSKASGRDIVRTLGIPSERVHVVYLAAEERFRPASDLSGLPSLRKRYRLPERYILYLGGFDQRRNIGTLLRAFARAIALLANREEHPLPRLVLAGRLPRADTSFAPDPQRIIAELGIGEWVRCIGHVAEADKPLLYQGADFFVFPSSYEGFGLPPLEAMACGVPVVAANATSLPEIVGDGGLLVGTLDTEGWARAITALWTHPERRQALRERSIAQAARFSWARTAQETKRVYEHVLGTTLPQVCHVTAKSA